MTTILIYFFKCNLRFFMYIYGIKAVMLWYITLYFIKFPNKRRRFLTASFIVYRSMTLYNKVDEIKRSLYGRKSKS